MGEYKRKIIVECLYHETNTFNPFPTNELAVGCVSKIQMDRIEHNQGICYN